MFNTNKQAVLEDQLEKTLLAILQLEKEIKWYHTEVQTLALKVQELHVMANRAYELGDTKLHREFMQHVGGCMQEGNCYWRMAQKASNKVVELKALYKVTQSRLNTYYSVDDFISSFDKWELEQELEDLKQKVSV